MKKYRLKLFLPLLLTEIYWIATYLIYRYGIVKYPLAYDNRLMIFLGLCDLLFAVGFVAVLRFRKKEEKTDINVNKGIVEKLLIICIIVSVLLAIPNSIRYTGNWYPQIFTNMANPGEAYQRVTAGVLENGILRIFGFFDIFPFMIFPLTFSMWDNIKTRLKIISCLVSFYYLLLYCTGGRNMPCLLFTFSIIVTYIIRRCSVQKKNLKAFIRDTLICVFAVALVLIMFTVNLKSRTFYSDDIEGLMTSRGDDPFFGDIEDADKEKLPDNEKNQDDLTEHKNDNPDIYLQYKDLIITKEQKEKCEVVEKVFPMYTNPYTKQYADPQSAAYQAIPSSLRFICVMGDAYLSGSYHALSVALRLDHKWTYGIGFSEFLQDYLKKFTGIDAKKLSYGSRIIKVTNPPMVSTYGWATAYTQFAGDLTFPGVVIFLGFLGAVVGLLWIDVVEKGNIFGVPFLIQMALLLVFIPANCITFNSGGYFVTFWGTAVIWVVSVFKRRREEKKCKNSL